jgi:hypothetical protein
MAGLFGGSAVEGLLAVRRGRGFSKPRVHKPRESLRWITSVRIEEPIFQNKIYYPFRNVIIFKLN